MNPNESIPITIPDYLRMYGQYLFGTPLGLAILGLGIALFIYTLGSRRAKWAWLALLMYAGTLQFSATQYFKGELLFPFNLIRSFGRPLTLLFLSLLLVPMLQTGRGIRLKLVAAPMLAYLAYEICFSTMLGFGGNDPLRGLLGGVVFVMMFGGLGLGLSKWIQRPEQLYTVLKAVLVAVGLLLLGTSIHVAVRPSMVVNNGRLTGTSSNPQVLGAIIAFSLPATYGLLFRKGESPLWRAYLAVALTLSVIFLIWTGSRAGALVSLIGVIAFFRMRLGQFLLVSLVAAVLVLTGLHLFSDVFGGSLSGGAHLLATNNSRAEVFDRLITTFVAHPITGVMNEQIYGETTYLSTAAAFGIIGLIPLALTIWLMGRASLRVLRRRRALGRHRVVADIAFATLAELVIGSAFDNHMMGTLTFAVFLVYICLTLYTAVLDPALFAPALAGAGYAGYGTDEYGAPIAYEGGYAAEYGAAYDPDGMASQGYGDPNDPYGAATGGELAYGASGTYGANGQVGYDDYAAWAES